jgi:hypothetical protein
MNVFNRVPPPTAFAIRIVAFSSGNVYPMTPVCRVKPTESRAWPSGGVAQSALGGERILKILLLAPRHAATICASTRSIYYGYCSTWV